MFVTVRLVWARDDPCMLAAGGRRSRGVRYASVARPVDEPGFDERFYDEDEPSSCPTFPRCRPTLCDCLRFCAAVSLVLCSLILLRLSGDVLGLLLPTDEEDYSHTAPTSAAVPSAIMSHDTAASAPDEPTLTTLSMMSEPQPDVATFSLGVVPESPFPPPLASLPPPLRSITLSAGEVAPVNSPAPSPPSPPPPPPTPTPSLWSEHSSLNCYPTAGAGLPSRTRDINVPGVSDLASCMNACLLLNDCDAIVISSGDDRCFLRAHIDIERCRVDGGWRLYVRNAHVPPPPPWRLPAPPRTPQMQTVVERINARFVHGGPSDDLEAAGVLVRQIDAMVDHDEWWRTHKEGEGESARAIGTPPWAAPFDPKLRDRLAASMINAKLPFIYSTSAVGFVLRPSDLQAGLWCSYPRDGNSMNVADHGCAGKGAIGSFKSLAKMMVYHINHLKSGTSCLWGAPNAADRSSCQYNEVVLNGELYASKLPYVIEAVFFPEGGQVHHREGDESRARLVHRRFVQAYGHAYGPLRGVPAPPLLAFDVQHAKSQRAPFREVSLT